MSRGVVRIFGMGCHRGDQEHSKGAAKEVGIEKPPQNNKEKNMTYRLMCGSDACYRTTTKWLLCDNVMIIISTTKVWARAPWWVVRVLQVGNSSNRNSV